MNPQQSLSRQITDQLGRKVQLPKHPQRIVSLCPSITETLYFLLPSEKILGRTRFCIHPEEEVKTAIRVGGTKEIKFDRLHDLKPDLIIGEKEENTPEMIAELSREYPVVVTDVQDVPSALEMIRLIGDACAVNEKAVRLASKIEAAFSDIITARPSVPALYLIWKDPWMAAGKDTYINDLLTRCGVENLALNLKGRYPTLRPEDIRALNPALILLSSEPYPFKDHHLAELIEISPRAEVRLVDGEMFSWYGVRMLEAASYLSDFVRTLSS